MHSHRAWRGLIALGAALFAAVACARIVGDDGIVISPAPPVEAGLCEPGQFHCEGAALQVCRDGGGEYRTVQVCSTKELCCETTRPGCDRIGCAVAACAAGDFRCTEEAVLETCKEDRTGWERIDVCASGAQCNASLGRCTDQPCNSDAQNPEYQCNGAELERCASTGWQFVASCQTASLCALGRAASQCQPSGCLVEIEPDPPSVSAFECDNSDLRHCNDAQTGFEYVETCVNAVNCNPFLGVGPGELSTTELAQLGCRAPACISGTYRCEGAELLLCDANRAGYLTSQATCASPSHCNASLGRCEPDLCVAGVYQCSGNELLRCAEDQTWQVDQVCASGTRCDLLARDCVERVCEVAEYQCTERMLSRCNVDGSGWIPVHECATNELCNAASKRCDEPVCEPNQRRCSRDGKLQLCAPGRESWLLERDCAAEAMPPLEAGSPLFSGLCDPAGSCLAQPSCLVGGLRCNGQFLERCEGNRWRPQARCGSAELCNATGAGSCREPICVPGEHRCVMPGATPVVAEPDTDLLGLTLQLCNTSGTAFVTVRECTGQLCDAAHGQCDLCASYETLCNADVLERCSADGQEKELEKYCREGCIANSERADAGASAMAGRAACREDSMSSDGEN